MMFEQTKIRLRGAITKKTGKFGKNFQRGWGVENSDEISQFQFGNFENPGLGLVYSNMSELKIRVRHKAG